MKHLSKKKVIVGIGIILLIAGCIGYRCYQTIVTNRIVRSYVPSRTLVNYAFVLDGKGIVLNWEEQSLDSNVTLASHAKNDDGYFSVNVGKRYVVSQEMSLKFKYTSRFSSDYRNTYEKGEYYNLDIYDIEDNMSMKTADVFKLVRQFDSNLVPDDYVSQIAFAGDEEYAIIGSWDMSKMEGSYYLALNLDTLEVSWARDIDNLHSAQNGKNDITDGNNLGDSDSQLGGYFVGNKFAIGANHFPAKDITSQWLLKTENATAYSIFLKNSYLYLLDDTVNLDTQAAALALFYPEGTNIFQNVTIDADYSVDGQEHTVNSYDEFIQYFKADK